MGWADEGIRKVIEERPEGNASNETSFGSVEAGVEQGRVQREVLLLDVTGGTRVRTESPPWGLAAVGG